jgi:hypothetical protein
MKLFELFIDELEEMTGVNALSLVENPAIMSDWVALGDQKKIMLAEVNADRQILMGAALIPNKPIYREMDGEEFYIFFSEETVAKAAEMFFKKHNQQNATLEHDQRIDGMTVFESWIVDDPQLDKSKKYGLDVPKGTWMVSMKVDDKNIWDNYVKDDKVFGFSIEGQFANALVRDNYNVDMSQHINEDRELNVALENVRELLSKHYSINK